MTHSQSEDVEVGVISALARAHSAARAEPQRGPPTDAAALGARAQGPMDQEDLFPPGESLRVIGLLCAGT